MVCGLPVIQPMQLTIILTGEIQFVCVCVSIQLASVIRVWLDPWPILCHCICHQYFHGKVSKAIQNNSLQRVKILLPVLIYSIHAWLLFQFQCICLLAVAVTLQRGVRVPVVSCPATGPLFHCMQWGQSRVTAAGYPGSSCLWPPSRCATF